MIGLHHEMVLATSLYFLHYMDAKDVTTLRVCEGRVANFTNDYETTGHYGLYYFRSKTGHRTQIYEMETFGQKHIIPADYKNRFNRTSSSEVGFILSNVSSSDEGRYVCLVLHPDGSEQRFSWILQVEDSRKINKPKINSSKDKSGCEKHICSHNETVKIEMYWIAGADKRVNRSSLYVCENNRTETIKCFIKSFCDETYVEKRLNDACAKRGKRSTSTDQPIDCQNSTDGVTDITDDRKSSTDGNTATGESTQTPSFDTTKVIPIVIGIIISIIIIIICTITVFYFRYRRKRNPKKHEGNNVPMMTCQEDPEKM